MRIRLPVLLLLLVASSIPSQAQWVHVETVRYDWSRDGKVYTFVLDVPKNWDAGGYYSRLRIFAPNGSVSTFVDDNGLTKLTDVLGPNWIRPHLATLVKKNPVRSQYLLFLPAKRNSRKPFLLFLFGWPYASSPGSIHVIALDNGMPKQILYRSEFQPIDYVLSEKGPTIMIGVPCLSEVWGNDLLTYAPYCVYTFPSTGATHAQLSLRLSKEYNLQHYYGWAGPKCSENLAVVLHPPGGGKPVIMDAKRAVALADHGARH